MKTLTLLVLAPLLLPATGCMGLVTAVGVASGVVTIAKDVLDIDMSLRQDKAGKTPVGALLPVAPLK